MRRFTKVAMAAFFMGFLPLTGFTQETEGITDEQLYKYALLQEVIEHMKRDISVEINQLIKAQEGMTGQRYKELAAADGDDSKLAEIEAQEWEIKFIEQVDKIKEDRTEAIKSVNSDLATKMVGEGGKIYKEIRDQLKSNEDLKARYEAFRSKLKFEEDDAD